MEGFCRGCLNKYNDPTELLQYTEKNRRLFVYSTGIQVKRNDLFTFQLCKDCYLNMKVGCKFKKMCRSSDKKFRSYLSLKETAEITDFNTFLKNNDDSFTFRLPMLGSGTPSIKIKDDDNESTCTSIQNFISDIMETEEIPATEARIIREVIEEEADVLDDSLDSHWLQDDVSIETDFKLDFSFSPFSTPDYVNNDRCYTPRKIIDDPQPIMTSNIACKTKVFDESSQEYLEKNDEEVEQKCTIDKNLENALQDENNESFYLNDLLVTPLHLVSGPPTPLITNILFGEKLEENVESPTRPIQCPDNYDATQSECGNENKLSLLEEFFSNAKEIQEKFLRSAHTDDPDTGEIRNESDHKEQDANIERNESERESNTVSPDHAKYSVTNFYCKMCKKQFKNLPALKVHCTKRHKFKIKHKTPYVRKVRICDNCGKTYHNLAEFITHVHSHNISPSALICKFCTLKFSSEAKLKMHMTTHVGKFNASPPKKKYVCSTCGSSSSSAANLKTHQLRHSKSYTIHCEQCGRGFYRRSDLVTHMRHHTGEKPFTCQICDRGFARRDVLNRHMKCHTDERPFRCQYCNLGYAKRQELKTHMEKGKACREKRQKLAENTSKEAPRSVSVYYGTVNSTDIRLAELKQELTLQKSGSNVASRAPIKLQ